MADNKVIENPYKGLEIVDGHAVKAPEDYQDPKMLYEALIKRIRKYHPSTDISMVEKRSISRTMRMKDSFENQVRHTLFTRCG